MENDKNAHQCVERIWDGWHSRQCKRNAEPGTQYCKSHNPESIKAKKEARAQAYATELQQREAAMDEKRKNAAIVNALRQLHNANNLNEISIKEVIVPMLEDLG